MNILIIGSKGFIGSHLQQYFETKGYTVYSCDVVVDYITPNYFLIDATSSRFDEIFRLQRFDACVNCSGAASVPDSWKNTSRDFELNVANVSKILQAIYVYNSSCKFINLSSAAVYGNPAVLPVIEQAVLQPLSPYGVHKKMAEDICTMYFEKMHLPTAYLRIFSAYGIGLRKQIVWDIIQKMRNNPSSITLFGTGKETRDFIHVSDICASIELILLRGKFEATAYNIGSGMETSIAQLADLIKQEMQFKGDIFFTNEQREGDPLNWRADTSAINALGFSASSGFDKYLTEIVAWATR